MTDNMILNNGGSEEDILKYSEQNGGNLTEELILIEREAYKHSLNYEYTSSVRSSVEVAFIAGAKSRAAKEYHIKGLYTEEEVKELIENAVNELNFDQRSYIDITDWFEQNKKK